MSYLETLKGMIKHQGLDGRVEIKTNVSLNELVRIMAESKVYFHTMSGEHFGISIVEAMSAGLIPVVPDYGGQTEFVPSQYQYHTLDDAAKIVERCLDVPQRERLAISEIAHQFSKEKFKSKMKDVIKRTLRL